MSTAWSPPRTADELPDDDHEAAYQLTGGLYDGLEIERRKRKLWPWRNCKSKDPEMTRRFEEAVIKHTKELMDLEAKIKSGELKLEDISDDDIVFGLAKLAHDMRRPSVQLGAYKTLAEMRGLIRNNEAAPLSDEALEQALEEARERRAARVGPRILTDGDVAVENLGGTQVGGDTGS